MNGQTIKDAITVSAFEISFSSLDLNVGDSVRLVIYHRTDCQPKVLNSGNYHTKSNVVYTEIKVEKKVLISETKKVTIDKNYNDHNRIDFSKSTSYQPYRADGEILLEGEPKEIDLSQLPNGTYYLNFDNIIGEVITLKR